MCNNRCDGQKSEFIFPEDGSAVQFLFVLAALPAELRQCRRLQWILAVPAVVCLAQAGEVDPPTSKHI